MNVVQLVGKRHFVVFVMVAMAIFAFVAPDEYRFLSGMISTPLILVYWFVWVSDVSTVVKLLMTTNDMVRALGEPPLSMLQPTTQPPPRPRRPIRISDPSATLDDLD